MPSRAPVGDELGCLRGRLGTAPPGGRVVAEDLERSPPICRARRAARSSPFPTPRWIPTAGAPAGHVSRRRGSGRATVRAMVDAHDEPLEDQKGSDGSDFLTVALFVYFVALIVLVAGLLVLPAIY